jgi:hypothetical protein
MGTGSHQVVLDKFTLFQLRGAGFAHYIGLSPPSFESHRLELELGLAVPITSSAYSLNAVTPHIKRLGEKLARKSLYPLGTSLLYNWPWTTDAQWSLFSLKSRYFGLGQTNWADKFWGVWGISGQTISTHVGRVSPLSILAVKVYKDRYVIIHRPSGSWLFWLEL